MHRWGWIYWCDSPGVFGFGGDTHKMEAGYSGLYWCGDCGYDIGEGIVEDMYWSHGV